MSYSYKQSSNASQNSTRSLRQPCHLSHDSDHPDTIALEATALTRARAEALEHTLSSSRPRLATYKSATLPLPVPAGGWSPRDRHDLSRSVSQDESSPSPPSLSVYNSPTATYMWPSLQLSSQMTHSPVLYVKYKDTSSSRASESDTETSSPVVQEGSSRQTGLPSLSRKRRPSTEVPCSEPSLSRLIEPLRKIHVTEGSPRNIRESGSNSPESRGNVSDTVGVSRESSPSSKRTTYQRGDINFILNSPTDEVFKDESSQHSRHGKAPERSETSGSAIAPSDNWEDYARQVRKPDGGLSYQCFWTIDSGPSSITCGYTSKKQLVKRHIETTHLKFKPFICDICNKAFPQKTSLDIHRHGHTGDTPHACIYNCGKSFKDPARRHRHHVEVHGYVPRQSKKKYKTHHAPIHEPSEYESIDPWTLRSDANATSTVRQ